MAFHPFEWFTLARFLVTLIELLADKIFTLVMDNRLISRYNVPELVLIHIIVGVPSVVLVVKKLVAITFIHRVALFLGDGFTLTCFVV